MTTTPETPCDQCGHAADTRVDQLRDGRRHHDYRRGLNNGQRGTTVSSELEGFRVLLDERQELASRQLAGLSPARPALLAPVDRSERDAITEGSPEHGDGIDPGW